MGTVYIYILVNCSEQAQEVQASIIVPRSQMTKVDCEDLVQPWQGLEFKALKFRTRLCTLGDVGVYRKQPCWEGGES